MTGRTASSKSGSAWRKRQERPTEAITVKRSIHMMPMEIYYGDGLNLYAYCHNNPVRYVDPSGHEGLICSKKYGELKKKETEGGTLSEKEKRQIYEQMVLEKQIMLLILLRVGAELHWNLL